MIDPLPRVRLLAIAFVQGLVLFALYRAFEADVWPSGSPLWSYPLWTLAVAIPLLLLLTLDRGNTRAVVVWTGVASVVLVLLALYTASQTEPYGEFPVAAMTTAFIVTIGLACFKGLMYLQLRVTRESLSYRVLFKNSWRNFLVLGLACVFTLLLVLVLMLWAALFNVIDIEFFGELFRQSWFLIPVLSVAFGLAVVIFRGLTRIIDSITRLLHGLIKMLLPLIVLVSVLFLLALPFVGIEALWSTGSGTSLLLWLLAVMLFCTNAVYQDGREADTYSRPVHRFVYGGLCTMPVISVLSFYGLAQRIAQYGWTVERAWAVVVWAILSLFAIGYVVGIVRRRDQWTTELARWNTTMGLVVLAVMLLANSPLLDFRKLSLASQLARVESGEISLQGFDFWYVERNLGRPGYLAVEAIRRDIGSSDPELLAAIDNPFDSRYGISPADRDAFWDALTYRPEKFDVPDGVRKQMEDFAPIPGEKPVLIRIDLDEDGRDEYLLLRQPYPGLLYYLDAGVWVSASVQRPYSSGDASALIDGEIRLVEPRFKDLEIGGIRLQVNSRD